MQNLSYVSVAKSLITVDYNVLWESAEILKLIPCLLALSAT